MLTKQFEVKVLDFQERSCFTNPVFLCCWKNVTVKSTFKNLSLIYTVLFIQIPHYLFISEAMFTKTKQKTQPMGFKNTCKVICMLFDAMYQYFYILIFLLRLQIPWYLEKTVSLCSPDWINCNCYKSCSKGCSEYFTYSEMHYLYCIFQPA